MIVGPGQISRISRSLCTDERLTIACSPQLYLEFQCKDPHGECLHSSGYPPWRRTYHLLYVSTLDNEAHAYQVRHQYQRNVREASYSHPELGIYLLLCSLHAFTRRPILVGRQDTANEALYDRA